MTQKNLRANPRCGSVSPTGRRCEKPDIHNRTEETVTHQNGSITWTEDAARCRSVSPETDRRCKLPIGHGLTADSIVTGDIVHKNGPYSWEVGLRTGATWTEEINPEVASGGWTTTDPTIAESLVDEVLAAYGNPNIRVTGPTSWVFTKAPSPESDQQPQYAEDRFQVRTSPEDELRAWWLKLAETEIDRTVSKAVEYGATDLAEMGHRLAAISGRRLSDRDAAEWGVWMYVVGKLGRVTSAMERGELPSDDTVFDLGVYVRMVQRIRETGGWPGVPQAADTDPTTPRQGDPERDNPDCNCNECRDGHA